MNLCAIIVYKMRWLIEAELRHVNCSITNVVENFEKRSVARPMWPFHNVNLYCSISHSKYNHTNSCIDLCNALYNNNNTTAWHPLFGGSDTKLASSSMQTHNVKHRHLWRYIACMVGWCISFHCILSIRASMEEYVTAFDMQYVRTVSRHRCCLVVWRCRKSIDLDLCATCSPSLCAHVRVAVLVFSTGTRQRIDVKKLYR